MSSRSALITGILLVCMLVSTSAQIVQLQFRHVVDADTLLLEKQNYHNALDQDFRVDRFRYYISNIQLISKQQSGSTDSLSYLIDEDEPSSKTLKFSALPSTVYTGIEFLLGVDSIHNCAGLQEGSLDPVHGMFWAWNTGYIFLKLDGHSSVSSATAGILEYHIGGYRWPNNCIRRIRLDFKEALTLKSTSELHLLIETNIAQLFRGAHVIDFSKLPTITDITNATLMADNYQQLFRLVGIEHRPRSKPLKE